MKNKKPANAINFNFLDTYYDGIYTSVNLDYTRCFKYQGLPLPHQDNSSFANSYTSIINALNSLDTGLVLTFVRRNRKEYRGILDKHLAKMKSDSEFEQARIAELRSKYTNIRAIEQFVFVTERLLPETPACFERYNPLSRPKLKYSRVEHEKRKTHLQNNIQLLTDNFFDTGLKIEEMTPDEVGSYCYYHLNHSDETRPLTFPIYTALKDGTIFRAQKTIREQVLDSQIEIGNDHIKVGEKYITVMCVNVLGTCADFEFYDKLAKIISPDHEYLVRVERIENDELYRQFKANKDNVNAIVNVANNVGRDTEEVSSNVVKTNRAILQDAELYKEDIEGLNLQSFKFAIMFTIKTDTLEELRAYVRNIQKMSRQHEFYDTWLTINPEFIVNNYHAFLPGNSHQIFDFIYNHTLSLMFYLPLKEEYKGYDPFNDTKPSNQLYQNRYNELVKYHTYYFDSNFKHAQITASTGSGKSFDLNKQIDGILSEQNPDTLTPSVIAIEPKRGFLKMCRYYDGEYISYNLASQKSYNPFFRKKDVYVLPEINYEGFEQSKKYDALIFNYYEMLLQHLCREEGRMTLSPRIRGAIRNVLTALYDEHDDDYIPILMDIIEAIDALKVDDSDFQRELSRVKENLKYYCHEQFQNLFNIREELNIANDFLYFDLGSLDDDEQLKTTVLFIISSSIMRKLRQQNRIKYLIIDEASVFHNSEIGAAMINYFLRLSRSLGGVIMLASQNVSDSIDSLAAKTIHNSLAVETCLWLKDGHQYLESIGYNPQEKAFIQTLVKRPGEYVELFRKIDGKAMVLQSASDKYLYWLSTNTPEDDAIYLQYQQEHKDKSFSEVIQKLGEDYPHGYFTKA